jgi:nitrogen fixation protein FixH
MKFHWGTGLVIAMLLFMTYILYFVYRSFQHDVNLVSTDYYEQEIAHESHIEKQKNEMALAEKILVQVNEDVVKIIVPEAYAQRVNNAEVHFFRPSSDKYDVKMKLPQQDSGIFEITKTHFIPGRYRLKLQWQMEEKAYYKEFDLNL